VDSSPGSGHFVGETLAVLLPARPVPGHHSEGLADGQPRVMTSAHKPVVGSRSISGIRVIECPLDPVRQRLRHRLGCDGR
jgi:hypothetical protein